MGAIGAVSKIPWKVILALGPMIIEKATDLIKHFSNKKPESKKETIVTDVGQSIKEITRRVDDIELYEKSQADLVKNISEQQSNLVVGLRIINSRIKYILILAVVSLLLSIISLITALKS